ncbi:MAG: Fic family protein [Candidatus Kapaibacterium sp.]
MKLSQYKAGTWLKQDHYQAFLPEKINHPWVWEDPRINMLLEEATQALGELNAFSLFVPDIDLFIRMHVVKEAAESSRIEGTQTKMSEAIRPREEIDPERRDDWQEVQNYIGAMNEAIEGLVSLPLSNRLLRNAHQTLMQGVRGEHKDPGEWRQSPSWIGGAKPQDAVFVPPPHYTVPELMGDLELFWYNEEIHVPHLVKAAISHYQFETIHPFLDGNGRIGRLLIPLYFIDKGLLEKPSLYLSSYLEKHKGRYYDTLTRVRESNDLGEWIRFFLLGVRETARQGREQLQKIMELRRRTEAKLLTLGARAERGKEFLNLLYKGPVVTVADVVEYFKVTHPTANKLVSDFQELGIIEELTGNRRNRLFTFEEYFRLFVDD